MCPIIFPVTYQCNLICSYCRERLKKTTIDVEASLNSIRSLDNPWVYITGGEPLLLPNIFSICDRLRAMGKKVGLTTNGTIPNQGIVEHVDRLGISIDGAEDLHDRNRGPGTWKLAIDFAKKVIGKVETVLMATVLSEDYTELRSIYHSIGFNHLQITKVI